MLKKQAQFFKSLLIISDLIILTAAWILSYYVRFYTTLISPPLLGIPPLMTYVEFLLPLWLLWAFVSNRFNVYRPRRIEHFIKEYFDVVKCLTFTLTILIAVIYLFKRFELSRLAFFYFWVMAIVGIIVARI